jgi:hypothetical protein
LLRSSLFFNNLSRYLIGNLILCGDSFFHDTTLL